VNSFGVDFGLQYAKYLPTGGTKITDTVKFPAGARDQKMHDNLHHISIEDKFNARLGPFSSSLRSLSKADSSVRLKISPEAQLVRFIRILPKNMVPPSLETPHISLTTRSE